MCQKQRNKKQDEQKALAAEKTPQATHWVLLALKTPRFFSKTEMKKSKKC